MIRNALQTVRSWLPAVFDIAAAVALTWGAAQIHESLAALVVAVGLGLASWRLQT